MRRRNNRAAALAGRTGTGDGGIKCYYLQRQRAGSPGGHPRPTHAGTLWADEQRHAMATAAIATVLHTRLQHWLGIQSFGLGNLTFLRHVLP